MRKIYLLDTNVLLHDPESLFKFDDNDIVLPMTVLEEMDKFKKDLSETGRNARHVARYLDSLRAEGRLTDGVVLRQGNPAKLQVVACKEEDLLALPPDLDKKVNDNKILAVAQGLMSENRVKKKNQKPVILVSKDINMRIKADTLGLSAQDYEAGKVVVDDDLYRGHEEIEISGENIDLFYSCKALNVEDLGLNPETLRPNLCVTLVDEGNPSHTAIARYQASEKKFVSLNVPERKDTLWGIRARNREQNFAIDLLLNEDISLVTIVGKAGTGKTLLAIAAGLSRTADDQLYNRVLVSRPIFPMGRDLGFLPGDIEEKLSPWMQPIFDNVDYLVSEGTSFIPVSKNSKNNNGSSQGSKSYKHLVDMGILEIEPLTYIRGRSIPKQYMIVDEAQNLTPHEVKTIITRAGEGTKIILTGDPHQIDNPYVDASSNGLTFAVEKFKNEAVAGHITLSKGERSLLAELASNLM